MILGEDRAPGQDPEGRAGTGSVLAGAFAPSAESSSTCHTLLLPMGACSQESSVSRSQRGGLLRRAGAAARQLARGDGDVKGVPAEDSPCSQALRLGAPPLRMDEDRPLLSAFPVRTVN